MKHGMARSCAEDGGVVNYVYRSWSRPNIEHEVRLAGRGAADPAVPARRRGSCDGAARKTKAAAAADKLDMPAPTRGWKIIRVSA